MLLCASLYTTSGYQREKEALWTGKVSLPSAVDADARSWSHNTTLGKTTLSNIDELVSPVDDLTRSDPEPIWAFIHESLKATGRAPRTQAKAITALQRFCRWAQDEGLLRRNPVAQVERPTVTTVAPRELTPEARYVLNTLVERQESKRLTAIVALAYGAALRISEVASLRIEHCAINQLYQPPARHCPISRVDRPFSVILYPTLLECIGISAPVLPSLVEAVTNAVGCLFFVPIFRCRATVCGCYEHRHRD
jgi:integrase